MRDYEKELEDMQNKMKALQKEMTMVQDDDGEEEQDGNLGMSQEETGEVDYEKQDKMTKKKMLIAKYMKG